MMHNLIARNLLKTRYKLKIYKINPENKKSIWLSGEERKYTNRADRINLKFRIKNQ